MKRFIRVLFNPAVLLTDSLEKFNWIWSLVVPGMSYCLFFLQTGMDFKRTGLGSGAGTIALGIIGLIFGVSIILVLSLLTWLVSRGVGCEWSAARTIKAFSFSYGAPIVYMLLGLSASVLFQWKTSLAFGLTGVLWSMGPIYGVIRQMFGGKTIAAALVASFEGVLLLSSWAIVGSSYLESLKM
ncbi:MAG: hypothetical protein EPN25_00320 [Nitrospirae bacterium]|nr:MAG: hypothetical protein EPN25_00320 [Nitrospirota bacterium]